METPGVGTGFPLGWPGPCSSSLAVGATGSAAAPVPGYQLCDEARSCVSAGVEGAAEVCLVPSEGLTCDVEGGGTAWLFKAGGAVHSSDGSPRVLPGGLELASSVEGATGTASPPNLFSTSFSASARVVAADVAAPCTPHLPPCLKVDA